MLKYAAALGMAAYVGMTMSAQEPACLHGPSETAAEVLRRRAALQFARQVNTLEARFHMQTQRYGQVGELSHIGPEPDGFHAQLSTNGATYAFSVKDTLDACHFAFFSDQQGVIYTGQPIR